MTDDVQQQPAPVQPASDPQITVPQPAAAPQPPANDPLASLEELLNKAKAKRSSSAAPAVGDPEQANPAGPSPEELEAQEKAKQLAEQQAQLAVQEQQAESDRLQQLDEQRQKMNDELQHTPEYQARQEQNQEEEQKAEEQRAEQQGHVIHQVTDDKV